jgi:hypothetical protein
MSARAALQLDLLSGPSDGRLCTISREICELRGRLKLILELRMQYLDFIFELGIFDSLIQVPLIGFA